MADSITRHDLWFVPLLKCWIHKIGEKRFMMQLCGSAGFCVKHYAYMYDRMEKTQPTWKPTGKYTLRKEKRIWLTSLVMNMILHGIEAQTSFIPIRWLKTSETFRKRPLQRNFANPPFGGKERKECNKTSTSKQVKRLSILTTFYQKFESRRTSRYCNQKHFLSNADNASVSWKTFIESCNLHTILICQQEHFGCRRKNSCLIFTKGEPTKRFGITNVFRAEVWANFPLNDDDLKEFKQLQKTLADSDNSWQLIFQASTPAITIWVWKTEWKK